MPSPLRKSEFALKNSAERELDSPSRSFRDGSIATAPSLEEEGPDSALGQTLESMLNGLRRLYTDAVMSGRKDRIGFETIVSDLNNYNIDLEAAYSAHLESVRTGMITAKREKETKIREWSERYNKLQSRWDECMAQITALQEEKEDLRQQTDVLLIPHKSKNTTRSQVAIPGMAIESKSMQQSFFRNMIETLLYSITEALAADRGSVFIFHSPSKELRSLCVVDTSSDKKLTEIRLSSRMGIVGKSFTAGEALNIAKAYQDKRFFKSIDMETGYVTNSVLCYPLYSPRTDTTIGVLQLINKKSKDGCFTLEDEARTSEYAFLLSAMLDHAKNLFDFGMGGSLVRHSGTDDTVGTEEIERLSPRSRELSRKGNQMNVKRIGHSQEAQRYDVRNSVGVKPNALVPKDLEEYIRKLEQCWRNAVKDCAFLHNIKVQLELEKNNAQNRVFTLEKTMEDLEEKLTSFRDMSVQINKQHKIQQIEAMDRERKLRQELAVYQQMREEVELQKQMYENNNLTQMLMASIGNNTNADLFNPATAQSNLQTMSENLRKLASLGNARQTVDGQTSMTPRRSQTTNAVKIENGVQFPSLDDKRREKNLSINIDGIQRHNHPADALGSYREGVTPRRAQQPQKDVFVEAFVSAPVPMCIVTKKYRIWRVNTRFCELLNCSDEEILGRHMRDICVIDESALPSMLTFDVVQGLGMHPPVKGSAIISPLSRKKRTSPMKEPVSEKSEFGSDLSNGELRTSSTHNQAIVHSVDSSAFTKVNVQISTVGDPGQKLAGKHASLSAPIYMLIFSKQQEHKTESMDQIKNQ